MANAPERSLHLITVLTDQTGKTHRSEYTLNSYEDAEDTLKTIWKQVAGVEADPKMEGIEICLTDINPDRICATSMDVSKTIREDFSEPLSSVCTGRVVMIDEDCTRIDSVVEILDTPRCAEQLIVMFDKTLADMRMTKFGVRANPPKFPAPN